MTEPTELTEDTVVRFLVENYELDDAAVSPQTELFDEGVLDSMAVAELLDFLESEGSFLVEPDEVTLENLGSVERMVAFASRKAVTA